MAVCILCDRSFGSKKALDQHRRDSPMHTDTFCKACNRTFGTNSALKQHEYDSPVHQRQSLGNATTVIPTSVLDSSLLPYDARADELCEDSIQRTSQTPLSSISDSVSNHYRHGPTPKNTLRAFSISVQEPIIKPPQVLPVNTPKRKPKRKEETRTSFRFPELHERIKEAVLPEVSTAWYQNNDRKGYNSEYVTCVVGSFSCNNQTCKKRSWGSGVVSILIRGYARNGYSAVVFNQRCKLCENLGTFTMDETTYVERVAYRIKKWAGVWVQQPVYNNNSKGPHAESLCEGCKGGACPYSIVQS